MKRGLIQGFVAWCKNLNRPLSVWWRCQVCGDLVFKTQLSLREHAGHKMDYGAKLTMYERFLIRFSLMKGLYE